MADQKAKLVNIPLKASLNLNSIECDIKNYEGFHDDNALFIGGVKNNLYRKNFGKDLLEDSQFITRKDNTNYYLISKGDKTILVNDDMEKPVSRLIDSTSGFARTGGEDIFEESHSVKADTIDVSWVSNNGVMNLSFSDGSSSALKAITTRNKNVRVVHDSSYVYVTVYSKGSAQALSDVQTLIYDKNNATNKQVYELKSKVTNKDNQALLWVCENNSGVKYYYVDSNGIKSTNQINFEFVDDSVMVVNPNTTHTTSYTVLNADTDITYSVPNVRINGLGIEIGLRASYTDSIYDLWTYVDHKGSVIEAVKDCDFIVIPGDVDYGLWSGGIKESFVDKNEDGFDINYVGGIPYSISSAKHSVKCEHNIDFIIEDNCDYNEITYAYDGKIYAITRTDKIEFSVSDRYVLLNIDSEDNTYDLVSNKLLNRANDYLGFAIPYVESVTAPSDKNENKFGMFASGFHVQYARDNQVDIGTILAPVPVNKLFKNDVYSYYCPKKYNSDIQVYWSNISDGVPVYCTTVPTGYDSNYVNIQYPISSDNNVVYNPSILDEIKDTYFNEYLFNDGQYSYVSTRTQNQSIVLGYYIFTLTEFEHLFIIAGTHYAIQGDYIIRVDVDNGVVSNVHPIAYKGDLEFIGATVTQALFYSKIDRSFYAFQGDLTLSKIMESNRVSELGVAFSMPSISTVVVDTNDGVLFFYQDQMIRITKKDLGLAEDEFVGRIYYTNNSFIFDYTEYCFLKRDGYERLPINIETEFYSTDMYVEDTNDCVYISLFDEEPVKGKVELSCMTLREGQFQSDSKVFEITPSMFDKNQGYLRLRYQPRFQTGAFSFKIKSDYPVAGLAISHKNNNVANAKYNL